jgi:hypothetical protein
VAELDQAGRAGPAGWREGHAAVAEAVAGDHLADRADRARGTVGGVPAARAVIGRAVLEMRARGVHRSLEGVGADVAALEVAGALRVGAGAEGFDHADAVALPRDQLGRAAADVDHQAPFLAVAERARHAHVDQAPFFLAGDDLDRIADRLFQARQDLLGIARHPQGVGGDHAHGVEPVLAQDAAKSRRVRTAVSCAATLRTLSGPRPAARRIGSRAVRTMWIWPAIGSPMWRRKLLEPRSTAAYMGAGNLDGDPVAKYNWGAAFHAPAPHQRRASPSTRPSAAAGARTCRMWARVGAMSTTSVYWPTSPGRIQRLPMISSGTELS